MNDLNGAALEEDDYYLEVDEDDGNEIIDLGDDIQPFSMKLQMEKNDDQKKG